MLRVLTLICCLNWSFISGQTFNKRFPLNSPSCIFSSVLATDTAYYVTGTRLDSVSPYNPEDIFLKIDLNGEIENLVEYQDSSAQRYASFPAIDFTSNDIIYAGSKINSDNMYVILSKINTEGVKDWEQEYESFYINFGNNFMVCLDLTVDEEGNIYTLHNATGTTGATNSIIIKSDSLGNIIWQKATGINNRYDSTGDILIASDGNIYVVATRWIESDIYEVFPYQNRIFKIDTSSNILWDYLTPESQGQIGRAYGMVEADDGGLVVNSLYGYEGSNGLNRFMQWEKYIYKISAEGELVWDLEIPSSWLSGGTAAWRMVKVSDGSGYVAAGNDLTYDGGEDSISRKGWLGKVDDDGNLLWARKHQWVTSLKNTHELYDIKEAPDGGFVAVGYAKDRDADTLQTQAWVIKTDEYGCLVPGCQLTSADNPELPQIQVSLYPNPVADILNIWYTDENFQSRRPPRFQVTDALGRIWQSFTAGSNETTYMLSVRELPPGTYYLSCSEKEGAIPFVVY